MTTSADDPRFSRMLLEDGSGYWLFEDGSIINWNANVETIRIDARTGVVTVYETTLGVTVVAERATQ